MRKKISSNYNNIALNSNFQDSIKDDYVERWLEDEFQLYFDFLETHYKIIEFRLNKRLELIKKYPYLEYSEIRKKIDKMQKKEFGNQLTYICERKINSFLS